MTLPVAFLDELRARTTLSTLIGRTVKLTRACREFKARCPFHQEKTPSFWVNDEKGFYHCFGCSAHGDAIEFLTQGRGLGFMDAVRELAAAAGLDVPAAGPTQGLSTHVELHSALTAASRLFVAQLHLPDLDARQARAYLEGRGISRASIDRFCLGFAPDRREGLRQALAVDGDTRLIAAGLLGEPRAGGEPYDRFRNRLIFPIRDVRGRVISFGGRALGDVQPKYLNGPETAVFDKGRTLFNLDRAAPIARRSGRIIVVEGYLDVVMLDQAGIAEAVAPLGTALTEGQLQLLWNYSPAPLLCFDGDAAGRKAAIRAARRAMPLIGAGRSLAFVAIPAGLDPDDFIRAHGAPAFEALLANPVPLVDFVWAAERDALPLDTPESRALLWARLAEQVAAIVDPEVRRLYRDHYRSLFDQLNRGRRVDIHARRQGKSAANGAAGMQRLCTLLAIIGLLRHPELIRDCLEPLVAAEMDADLAAVRDAMVAVALIGPVDDDLLDQELARRSLGRAMLLRDMRALPALACLKAGPLSAPAAEQLRQLVHALAEDTRRRVDPRLPIYIPEELSA